MTMHRLRLASAAGTWFHAGHGWSRDPADALLFPSPSAAEDYRRAHGLLGLRVRAEPVPPAPAVATRASPLRPSIKVTP